MSQNVIIERGDLVLVTGAGGYLGLKVVELLLASGFTSLRCLARSSRGLKELQTLASSSDKAVEIIQGNLLRRGDCRRAVEGASIIFHLAAGSSKSFAGCFMDSVVATRNLLDAALELSILKRFVSISSLAVHSGLEMKAGALLTEDSPIERDHMKRYDPYCYGKIKQDELVMNYGSTHGLPYVVIRPGPVYGPGKRALTGRVGTGAFGLFVHVGGNNQLPLIYVDNCASAIVAGGLAEGVDGEVFIAVDDELPTSRRFLKLYKENVANFRSIRIPYRIFFWLSWGWEKYAEWSEGQLPPAFNRRQCATYYQSQRYSNQKLKQRTGWSPKVSFEDACRAYFEYMRAKQELVP